MIAIVCIRSTAARRRTRLDPCVLRVRGGAERLEGMAIVEKMGPYVVHLVIIFSSHFCCYYLISLCCVFPGTIGGVGK